MGILMRGTNRWLILRALGLCVTALLLAYAQSQPAPKKGPPKQFTLPESRPNDPVLVTPPTDPEPLAPNLKNMPTNTLEPLAAESKMGELALLGRTRMTKKLDVGVVIGAILGFVAFFVLAYLAGHPRVTEWEHRLKIGQMLTSGLPFVALGFIAAQPAVGVLNQDILREIKPLVPLGLGWIGFVVGSRFDSRRLESVSTESEASVFLTTIVPILMIFGTCALMVYPLGMLSPDTPGLVRDGLLLAIAGAMSARTAFRFTPLLGASSSSSDRLERIIELEQLAGVVGLFFLCVFFRPPQELVGWQLPSFAWIFMTLGVGGALGLVLWALLTRLHSPSYFPALLLGAVAFTAGMASFLRLSSLTVCFLAGALIINLGGEWRDSFRAALERMERPVYFLFLLIAGALWHPWDGRGWVLMALFVVARAVATWVSAWLVRKYWVPDLTEGERRVLAHSPMGALSVAMVLSAYDLYSGPTVALIVTAIIGGSMLSEIALQVSIRRTPLQEDVQEVSA